MARYQTTSVQRAPASEVAAPQPDKVETLVEEKEGAEGEVEEEEEEGCTDGSEAYDLSGWSGKTPKTMLMEWFQKRQQPRPKSELEQLGRKYRAAVLLAGGARVELPEGESFDKKDTAEQAAATAALLHLFPEQPLYRLLPPSYRALWLKWAAQHREHGESVQQEEAVAALLARDKFVQSLVVRPLGANEPIRVKKKLVPDEGDAGEVEIVDEAAQARMRQAQREAEDEEEMRLDEEERRQEQRQQKQTADNARLQVAFERFQQSEVGQKAAAFRNSLPIHTLHDPLVAAMESRQVVSV